MNEKKKERIFKVSEQRTKATPQFFQHFHSDKSHEEIAEKFVELTSNVCNHFMRGKSS
jgi:hypothetical protein